MKKHKWIKKFKKMFNLKQTDRITFYRNPKDCHTYKLERINPMHVGIITGKRKNSSKNWIKVCKIYFSNLLLLGVETIGNVFEKIQIALLYIINDVSILGFVYYIFLAIFFYSLILLLGTGQNPFKQYA